MASYTDNYDKDMRRELLSHDDLMQYHENLYAIDGMQPLLKGKEEYFSLLSGAGQKCAQ